MSALSETKLIRYQEYRQLEADDDLFYELLNGRIVKKNAPSPRHQIILQNLNRSIDHWVFSKKLGQVLLAPVDVFLDEYNAPHPDLVYISKEKESIITHDGIIGVPDLVMEIISPSSIVRDRVEKMKLYERFQIPEYWVVDPAYDAIEVYALNETGQYQIHANAVKEGSVQSKVLDKFNLGLDTIF